jgi:hypothetical protein
MALGLLAAITTNFLSNTFQAAKVSYSSWMLPGIAIVLGAALAARVRWGRIVAVCGMGLLLLCQMSGVIQLWVHGDYFAHCSFRQIHELVNTLPQGRWAIVYEESDSTYPFIYFPMRYTFGKDANQFIAAAEGKRVPGVRLDPEATDFPEQLSTFEYLAVIRTKQQTATEIAHQVRSHDQSLDRGSIARRLEESGAWRTSDHKVMISFVAADVVFLKKVPDQRYIPQH